jgi:hypothetical protein
MKKAFFSLCLIALVLPLFADDALVMPAKVIRTYIVGAYADITKQYDSDGKSQDLSNDVTAINLGGAVEYGVNDWITGAVQWAPGYFVYSKISGDDKATLADAADLFVGAKLQIIGPKAPVQNESIRLAFAPGVKIPLSSPDWAKQAQNYGSGDTYLGMPADRHTLGIGGRAYFDYVLNDKVFLNLYSQFIFYPTAVKAVDASLADYITVGMTRLATSDPSYDPSLKYGYDLTLEFEPHFNTMISDGLQFESGLPITLTMSPARSASNDTYDVYSSEEASNLLTVGPNVSLFFQKTFLPLELKLGYSLPLMGKNESATNTVVLELKAYAKF